MQQSQNILGSEIRQAGAEGIRPPRSTGDHYTPVRPDRGLWVSGSLTWSVSHGANAGLASDRALT